MDSVEKVRIEEEKQQSASPADDEQGEMVLSVVKTETRVKVQKKTRFGDSEVVGAEISPLTSGLVSQIESPFNARSRQKTPVEASPEDIMIEV
jgi:hypothetical protein